MQRTIFSARNDKHKQRVNDWTEQTLEVDYVRYLTHLQNAVNERYERLVATDTVIIDHHVSLVHDWINTQPELRAIITEAEQVEPGLDYDTWRNNLEDLREFKWPSRTEAGMAWLVWQLMKEITANLHGEHPRQLLSSSRRFRHLPQEQARAVAMEVFRPLFLYLSDQVGLGSVVVHVLQRYVARIEWFDRDELYRQYREVVNARRVGEDVYNLDLQRFLFLDGGYITHAKARAASGEPDLVGGLDTDDPLICEGKLYDGKGRGTSYLAKGFHQVIRAAYTYNKTVAYLIVFNMTEKHLQFCSDGPVGAWAPYVQNAGVRVHLIVVRACPPTTTDSKAGKVPTVVVSRGDLVVSDDQEDNGVARPSG